MTSETANNVLFAFLPKLWHGVGSFSDLGAHWPIFLLESQRHRLDARLRLSRHLAPCWVAVGSTKRGKMEEKSLSLRTMERARRLHCASLSCLCYGGLLPAFSSTASLGVEKERPVLRNVTGLCTCLKSAERALVRRSRAPTEGKAAEKKEGKERK